MAIYSGFTHWKWWFSIVLLTFTRRVCPAHGSRFLVLFRVDPQPCFSWCRCKVLRPWPEESKTMRRPETSHWSASRCDFWAAQRGKKHGKIPMFWTCDGFNTVQYQDDPMVEYAYGWTTERVVVTIFTSLTSWGGGGGGGGGVLTSLAFPTFNYVVNFSHILHGVVVGCGGVGWGGVINVFRIPNIQLRCQLL